MNKILDDGRGVINCNECIYSAVEKYRHPCNECCRPTNHFSKIKEIRNINSRQQPYHQWYVAGEYLRNGDYVIQLNDNDNTVYQDSMHSQSKRVGKVDIGHGHGNSVNKGGMVRIILMNTSSTVKQKERRCASCKHSSTNNLSGKVCILSCPNKSKWEEFIPNNMRYDNKGYPLLPKGKKRDCIRCIYRAVDSKICKKSYEQNNPAYMYDKCQFKNIAGKPTDGYCETCTHGSNHNTTGYLCAINNCKNGECWEEYIDNPIPIKLEETVKTIQERIIAEKKKRKDHYEKIMKGRTSVLILRPSTTEYGLYDFRKKFTKDFLEYLDLPKKHRKMAKKLSMKDNRIFYNKDIGISKMDADTWETLSEILHSVDVLYNDYLILKEKEELCRLTDCFKDKAKTRRRKVALKICEYCGTENLIEARYCGECGQP
ncbi:MAG: hypothetical protein GY853_16435 [PVC group bacterium]|nr:hypothetical protein [PVC group bacterium]